MIGIWYPYVSGQRLGEKTVEGYFLISREDYDYVSKFNWHYVIRQKKLYILRYTEDLDTKIDSYGNRHDVWLHHEICPHSEYQVDHVNRDTLDYRRENLRQCNNINNQRNKAKRVDGLWSKYKGVGWHPRGKWRARIQTTTLGYYDTEEEAALAYNIAASKLFGDFAYLNDIKVN